MFKRDFSLPFLEGLFTDQYCGLFLADCVWPQAHKVDRERYNNAWREVITNCH